MPIPVVYALESIDVDHQACDGSAAALRTRQFLLQSLLQVASIVPARQEVRNAGAQQPRTIDRILDAYRSDRAQMRQKFRAVMAREARQIAAAETQRSGGAILARQGHEGRTLEVRCARKQQVMIGAYKGPEPRFVQHRELRCQTDQRI